MQVGIHPAGHSAVLVNKLVAKELELIGTFLSNEEFRWAVDVLVHGRIDIGPILTGEFSLADAISAFELASDRSKAMKVTLVLETVSTASALPEMTAQARLDSDKTATTIMQHYDGANTIVIFWRESKHSIGCDLTIIQREQAPNCSWMVCEFKV